MKNILCNSVAKIGRSASFLTLVALWMANAAFAQTVTFDFDAATPVLATGQNVPFDQTVGGISAHFSASAGGFSAQNQNSTFLNLSQFSGNYLYPNGADNGVLVITFRQPITNLAMDFSTSEVPAIENPTPIRLTAYTNSTSTTPVGSTTKAGTYFGVNSQPMGTLLFNSTTPFDVVKLNIEPGGATGFSLDNISVTVPAGIQYAILTTSSQVNGGTTTGDGTYLNGAPVTVVAIPNLDYAFVNWTDNGVEVATSPSYSFTASADRTLIANFTPQLRIALAADGAVVLTWPGPSTGYLLQQNATCAQLNWSATTNTVSVVGDQNQVTLLSPTGNCFYRLVHP